MDAIDLAFEPLRQYSIKRCANQSEFDRVLQAYRFAREVHQGQTRLSGDPIILHCIAVAKILGLEVGLGYKSIVAGLLHHVLTDSDHTSEELALLFGEKVAELVEGLGRLDKVFAVKNRPQAEIYKETILTLNNDVRVLLIKLADRLHNIREIDDLPIEKKARNLAESLYIFAPLAHRLGLYSIKSEMENIWMQQVLPAEYREIEQQLEEAMARLGEDIDRHMIQPIQDALQRSGFKFHIYRRTKTPYSIWSKMRKRNVGFDQIFDLFAIRIVFYTHSSDPEVETAACYRIEEILNSMWQPNPDRRRDWVTHPKDTGYQALQSTYLSPSNSWVEVQIRSKRMDDIAEKGIAAHWRYKGGTANNSAMETWLSNVRNTLANKDTDALEFFDTMQAGSLLQVVYVFTPKGEMRTMPRGATALDFAYSIHSQVGHCALVAKVNQTLVLLNQELHGGDEVEILTTEVPHPQLEWLTFVKTGKARTLIANALGIKLKDLITNGRALLETHLEEYSIKPRDRAAAIKKLQEAYHAATKEELYSRAGAGFLDLSQIPSILRHPSQQQNIVYWSFKIDTPPEAYPQEFKDKTFKEIRPARCCHPNHNQAIVGIPNAQNHLVVHHASCSLAVGPSLKMSWQKETAPSLLATLIFRGEDRMGMLYDITSRISVGLQVNMRRISVVAHDGIIEGRLEVYVKDTYVLSRLKQQIKAVKGIKTVR